MLTTQDILNETFTSGIIRKELILKLAIDTLSNEKEAKHIQGMSEDDHKILYNMLLDLSKVIKLDPNLGQELFGELATKLKLNNSEIPEMLQHIKTNPIMAAEALAALAVSHDLVYSKLHGEI